MYIFKHHQNKSACVTLRDGYFIFIQDSFNIQQSESLTCDIFQQAAGFSGHSAI